MPRHVEDDDDDWNPGDEPPDDDEADTTPCPNCREDVYDDAEQCPHCGHYLTAEEAAATSKPWWIVIGAVLCLFVTYFWVIHR